MAYADYHKQGGLKHSYGDYVYKKKEIFKKKDYFIQNFFKKKKKEKQRINYSGFCRKMFLKSVSLMTKLPQKQNNSLLVCSFAWEVSSHCLTMHSFTTVLCQV